MIRFEYFIINLKIEYIKFIFNWSFFGFSNLFDIFVLFFIASYFIIEFQTMCNDIVNKNIL